MCIYLGECTRITQKLIAGKMSRTVEGPREARCTGGKDESTNRILMSDGVARSHDIKEGGMSFNE